MWKTAVIFPAKCGSKSVQLRFLRRHIHAVPGSFSFVLVYAILFDAYYWAVTEPVWLHLQTGLSHEEMKHPGETAPFFIFY